MPSRHHIDDFMRSRITGKIEEVQKIPDVSREFDIAHSVASRLWKSFKTAGMCSRRHGGGRVRSTTPAEDSYIVLSAKRNRRTTAQQVANQFLAASGKQISRKTVARRLRGGGLYARRPVVCVPLTRQHRTARLQWCRELTIGLNRTGHAYYSQMREKDRYPTCSIMVWAGIMINGRTRLHVVVNGTMTGQRYIDEILLPHVRLFRGAVDLKPIENVWDSFGRQVAGRNYPPTNKNTLICALTEEWDKLPQQLLDNVVQTNGAVGKLVHAETGNNGIVTIAWLEFPELPRIGEKLRRKAAGHAAENNISRMAVPIVQRSCTIPLNNNKTIVVKRSHVPLVCACATTIHKSQGSTFQEIVYEYEKHHSQSLLYVALSRITSIEGLYITTPNNDKTFYHGRRTSTIDLQAEFKRLSLNKIATINEHLIEFMNNRRGLSLFTFNCQSLI
ncbi:ATP-dependent DNA helicase [Trichonephila clavipes]|nr:ATP-dependent DNA helicase [Trichonephila clavipes]